MTAAEPTTPPLTVREAAAYVRVSERAVRQWVQDGTLPAYRLGARGKRGVIRIARGDLDGLLAASRTTGEVVRPAAKAVAGRVRVLPKGEFRHLKI